MSRKFVHSLGEKETTYSFVVVAFLATKKKELKKKFDLLMFELFECEMYK